MEGTQPPSTTYMAGGDGAMEMNLKPVEMMLLLKALGIRVWSTIVVNQEHLNGPYVMNVAGQSNI